MEVANICLEHAGKAQDPDIALVFCHDTEVSLHQAVKVSQRADNQSRRHGVATVYIRLGRVLEDQGYLSTAKAIYKKAEKLGTKISVHGHLVQSVDAQSIAPSMKSTVDSVVDIPQEKPHQPVPSKEKTKKVSETVTLPTHVFAENVRPPTVMAKLPEPDERLLNTIQLAYCLAILKDSHVLDDILEPSTRKWIHIVENDEDEHERLK
ncbi:hypothetical protein BGX34_007099, partial [Mortierella sp. NVP85]